MKIARITLFHVKSLKNNQCITYTRIHKKSKHIATKNAIFHRQLHILLISANNVMRFLNHVHFTYFVAILKHLPQF